MCKYLESFNPVWRTDLVSAGLASYAEVPPPMEDKKRNKWNTILVPCVWPKNRPKQMLIGGCSPGWHRANLNLHNLIPRHIDPRPLVGDLLWPTWCGPQGFSNTGQGQFRRGHVVFFPHGALNSSLSLVLDVFTSCACLFSSSVSTRESLASESEPRHGENFLFWRDENRSIQVDCRESPSRTVRLSSWILTDQHFFVSTFFVSKIKKEKKIWEKKTYINKN